MDEWMDDQFAVPRVACDLKGMPHDLEIFCFFRGPATKPKNTAAVAAPPGFQSQLCVPLSRSVTFPLCFFL